jgi:hypothetical protein
MEIKRCGEQSSVKGSSDWFTGTVRIDPLFQAPDPAFVQGASVTFEPGARTAWHTHPLGQTLIVNAKDRHDPHRRSGKTRRQGRRMDGTRDRRAISNVKPRQASASIHHRTHRSPLREDPKNKFEESGIFSALKNMVSSHHVNHTFHHVFTTKTPSQNTRFSRTAIKKRP